MLDELNVSGSDNETEFDVKSIKSRDYVERKKRKRVLVPDDPDYTIGQFLGGIYPNLTSKQKSTQLSQDIFSQETLDSSNYDPLSRVGF